MKSSLNIAIALIFILLSPLAAKPGSHKPAPGIASCRISCTVADIAEWADTTFPSIDLPTLSGRNREAAGSSTLTLYTNGNVKFFADNSDAARLSKDASHSLLTQYKLDSDGDGVNQTGGCIVEWAGHDSFLSNPAGVTHVPGDGAVQITLSVKASKQKFQPGDAGEYNATQTLTASWN